MDGRWHDVCAADAFPDEGKLAVRLDEWSVLVVQADDGFHALNDRCTHQAALLSPGKVRRGAIMCPLHGARFEAATGRCIGGAYADLRRFPLRVEEGRIEVCLPDEAPGPHERPVQG